MTKSNYPLSIRVWYLIHNQAERLWHWVYRTKLAPWHAADRASRPPVPPTYHFIKTIPATEEEQARGITERRIYRTKA